MAKKDETVRERNIGHKLPKTVPAKPDEKQEAIKRRRKQCQRDTERATRLRTHRILLRTVVILSVMTVVYFYTKLNRKEVKFALVKETLPMRVQKFPCDQNFEDELKAFPLCMPTTCGRFVSDKLVDPIEAQILLQLANNIMDKVGLSSASSKFDLHSGALVFGNKFINIYNQSILAEEMQERHLTVFNLVKAKIHKAIADQYGITKSNLYLTHPTFFSRLTNSSAKTPQEEYWQVHADKPTYERFHYTSLLYLNSYNKDFYGGRFMFVDGTENNQTHSIVEPKKGRLLSFTSGEENTHFVEKVSSGVRYALTISFTCDPQHSVQDPTIQGKPTKQI